MKNLIIAKKLYIIILLCIITLCFITRSKHKNRVISSILQTQGPEDGYYSLNSSPDAITNQNKLVLHGIYDEVFSVHNNKNSTSIIVKFNLQYAQLVNSYEMFPETISIDTTLVHPLDDNKTQKIGKLSEILTSKDAHNLELIYTSDDNLILCYFGKKIASISEQGKIDIYYNNL